MSGELVLTDPDSREPLTMAVTSTEVRDDVGAVAATVSVMQDVSRLRELERRRMEQILFDSEKLAATGRLAASIAHEINNPLEAIKNALYLLANKIPPEDANCQVPADRDQRDRPRLAHPAPDARLLPPAAAWSRPT